MSKKQKKSRRGARGKYRDWVQGEGLVKVEAWARDGLTNKQIANNIGVNVDTIYTWQNRFSDFHDALKRGKEVVDIEVENSLLKRAMGYDVEEVKEIEEDSSHGIKKRTERHIKHITPDVTAQIFWLKNRKPEVWRDRHDHEHSGIINSNVDLSGYAESELRKLANKLSDK